MARPRAGPSGSVRVHPAGGERRLDSAPFNLDPRSERLNTEVMVVTESEDLAEQLLAVTRARQAGSWRIGRDGRPEGADRRHPGVSRRKLWRMRIQRLVVPFLRGQI